MFFSLAADDVESDHTRGQELKRRKRNRERGGEGGIARMTAIKQDSKCSNRTSDVGNSGTVTA